MDLYRKKPIFFIFVLFLKNVASDICQKTEPFLEFVSDCKNEDYRSDFKIKSAKKFNSKSVIKGNLEIDLLVMSSQSLKMNKCLKIGFPSSNEIENIKTSFKENLAYGSAEVIFKNKTRLLLELDDDGVIEKTLKYHKSGKLINWNHCSMEESWTLHIGVFLTIDRSSNIFIWVFL